MCVSAVQMIRTECVLFIPGVFARCFMLQSQIDSQSWDGMVCTPHTRKVQWSKGGLSKVLKGSKRLRSQFLSKHSKFVFF